MNGLTASAIVDPAWLMKHLYDENLRIIDSTVFLGPPTEPGEVFSVDSGRKRYEDGHIPGAVFVDLIDEASEPSATTGKPSFNFPSAERVERVMRNTGINDDSLVVLYSTGTPMWATRMWWVLRSYGFANAFVLDGGMQNWVNEGGPVTREVSVHTQGNFVAKLQADMVVSKADVLSALDDDQVIIIDSLTKAMYAGKAPHNYGRPGHIRGAINVSVTEDLTDLETGCFPNLQSAAYVYEAAGVTRNKKIISYCGGGIAATHNAFLLTQLGYEQVAIYDNSMGEWGMDENLPMEL